MALLGNRECRAPPEELSWEDVFCQRCCASFGAQPVRQRAGQGTFRPILPVQIMPNVLPRVLRAQRLWQDSPD